MKKIIIEFCKRGFYAAGFGPIVLAFIYLIINKQTGIETLSIRQVCLGIFSLYLLSFITGGINVIYQIEHFPLMIAIFIHGFVLYIAYLITYLVNDWIICGNTPIIIFTIIFVFSYLIIWFFIYSINKKNTDKINKKLLENQNENLINI